MKDYDFELDKAVAEINDSGAKKVYLQLPEGLKTRAIEIAEKLEEDTGVTVLVQVDPCYGACDTKADDVEKLGVDLIVHLGHTPYQKK